LAIGSDISAKPARSLQQHLVRLTALLLLPGLLLAVWLAIDLAGRLKGDAEANLVAGAQAAAQAVRREMESTVLLLETLATSPSLDAERLTGEADAPAGTGAAMQQFHAQLRQAMAPLGSFAVLVGRDDPERQVVNSRRAFETALPRVSPRSPAREVLVTGRPAFRAPYRLPEIDLRLPSIAVPVRRNGEMVAALGMAFPLDRLATLMADAQAGLRIRGVLMTMAGEVIAMAEDAESDGSREAPTWIPAAIGAGQRGLLHGPWLDGRQTTLAYARTGIGDWLVVMVLNQAEHRKAWLYPALRIAGVALLLVLGVGLVASIMIRRVIGQLTALTRDASRLPRHSLRVAEFEALAASVAAAQAAPRREAEAALRAAEANIQLARDAEDDRRLLKSVVQSLPEEVFVKDTELRYVLVNKAAVEAFGRPEEEILGRTDQELLEESMAAEFLAIDEDLMRSGTTQEFEAEVTMPGHGGERRVYLTVRGPWRDSSGRVAGLVGVARDVTNRRATEQRLRAAEEAMRRIARDDSLTAMGLGVAHELNQPLTAVGNFLRAGVRWLQEERPGPARIAAARDAMQEAAAQALRAGEIVRRLRDFIGRGETEQRIVSLGPLVADGVALTVAARGGGNLPVALDLSISGCLVLGDEVQLQQVFVNLLRNAIEATEGQANRGLAVTLHQEEGRAVLRFMDAGPGLPAEVRERLFDPFVSTKESGMGVGLAICRAIIEAHAGGIEAHPAMGGGTEFRIDLPLAKRPGAG